jgi:ribosomal protein S12 methylthiotransferase accessory factor
VGGLSTAPADASSGRRDPARFDRRTRASLHRLLRLWPDLVDPKVGVIANINHNAVDDDEPNFFHYLSDACDTAAFTQLGNFRNNGGVSSDRYIALAKAVGETVERYCSAIFDYDELILAPYARLRERATEPDDFALHSLSQYEAPGFPWQPFTADTPTLWTRGTSLVDGGDVLVPAAMVFVPFHYLASGGDVPILQPISTGLACGCTPSEAALGALCEVVERDAFTLMWQARISPPQIVAQSAPATVRRTLARFTAAGLDVKLLDITTDIRFPTIMTIALGAAETSPAVTVAAATDPSPERALVKSLEELAHTRKFARQLMQYTPELPVEVDEGHPTIEGQRDHLRFYCPQRAKEFIEFAWSSPVVRTFAELPDASAGSPGAELDALVHEVSQAGCDVIMCDLTSPDIRRLGLSVVRVVAPGLHPLFMGYQLRALGGHRLYTVPQRLGYAGLEPGQPDNPYPHPFP